VAARLLLDENLSERFLVHDEYTFLAIGIDED